MFRPLPAPRLPRTAYGMLWICSQLPVELDLMFFFLDLPPRQAFVIVTVVVVVCVIWLTVVEVGVVMALDTDIGCGVFLLHFEFI
jgi:hypothetical protein